MTLKSLNGIAAMARTVLITLLALIGTTTFAQEEDAQEKDLQVAGAEEPEPDEWDVTQARGETCEIDFSTSEGS